MDGFERRCQATKLCPLNDLPEGLSFTENIPADSHRNSLTIAKLVQFCPVYLLKTEAQMP